MMQFYNEENEISYVDENYLCHNILMKREEIYNIFESGILKYRNSYNNENDSYLLSNKRKF